MTISDLVIKDILELLNKKGTEFSNNNDQYIANLYRQAYMRIEAFNNENLVVLKKAKIDKEVKQEILKRLRLELSWLDDKKESFDESCKSKLEAIEIISNLPTEEN